MLPATDLPHGYESFFAATAGIAGALIGLLFVAISVSPHDVKGEGGGDQAHRIRAQAALTAFTNALTVSLFALIPTSELGYAAAIVGGIGVLFVAASLLSVLRLRSEQDVALREITFLVGMFVLLVIEMVAGIRLLSGGGKGPVGTLAIVLVVCFLLGIARAWELIGGPEIGFRREVLATLRTHSEHEVEPTRERPGDPFDG